MVDQEALQRIAQLNKCKEKPEVLLDENGGERML